MDIPTQAPDPAAQHSCEYCGCQAEVRLDGYEPIRLDPPEYRCRHCHDLCSRGVVPPELPTVALPGQPSNGLAGKVATDILRAAVWIGLTISLGYWIGALIP